MAVVEERHEVEDMAMAVGVAMEVVAVEEMGERVAVVVDGAMEEEEAMAVEEATAVEEEEEAMAVEAMEEVVAGAVAVVDMEIRKVHTAMERSKLKISKSSEFQAAWSRACVLMIWSAGSACTSHANLACIWRPVARICMRCY